MFERIKKQIRWQKCFNEFGIFEIFEILENIYYRNFPFFVINIVYTEIINSIYWINYLLKMIKSCIIGIKITEETISGSQLDIPPFTLCNEWNTLSDIYIIIIPSQTTCNEFPFSVSHSNSDHFKNTSYPLYLIHQHFHLCLTFQTLFSLLLFFIASSYSQLIPSELPYRWCIISYKRSYIFHREKIHEEESSSKWDSRSVGRH